MRQKKKKSLENQFFECFEMQIAIGGKSGAKIKFFYKFWGFL